MRHRQLTEQEHQNNLLHLFIDLMWILFFIIAFTSEAYGL
jgi:hypothetical protein